MQDVAAKPDSVQKPAGAKARSRKPRTLGLLLMFVFLLLCVVGAVLFGLVPRLQRQRGFLAEAKSDEERIPSVNVAEVRRAAAKGELSLPGTLQALNEASIYARVDGYIKTRYVDIGQKVTAGQPMIELDTPELDQQILQAEATTAQSMATLKQLEAAIKQAQANAHLAKVTFDRTSKLAAEGVLSKQDLDNAEAVSLAREADVAAAEANLVAGKSSVAVNEANYRRLKETRGFARINAPFNGVITFRRPDVGTLISSGNQGTDREMFRVADIDPMRIFVSVPQTYVVEIEHTAGGKAELTVDQIPGRKFIADVRRSNAALDPATRTMLTVLYIANPKAELLPGMFGEVKFAIGENVRPLMVPGDSIVGRSDGPHVAVVDPNGSVIRFRKIQPGRDLGSSMEVFGGLDEGEVVVENPTDEIHEGVKVQVRKTKK
jgi:RND family efflux transporter MFP subunit